jgi:hypothetical protein
VIAASRRGPDDAPTTSHIDGRSPRRLHTALSQAVGHELVNRVMASIQQLGDQILHSGQDITRTERRQRRDVVGSVLIC